MPRGAVVSEGSSGENITHFAAIRVRATGIGTILMAVYSLDGIRNKNLPSIVLASGSRIIPTRLVNFVEQRASFELRINEIDGNMKVHRLVIFMKELYTSYPGN